MSTRRSVSRSWPLVAYREGLDIGRGVVLKDPEDTNWRSYLSEWQLFVANMLVQLGDPAGALAGYREGLSMMRALIAADSAPAIRAKFSAGLEGLGDLQVAQGNLPEALKSYRESLAVRLDLAKAEPSNTDWQRQLSVSYDKIANVVAAQGNRPEALKSFRASLAIRERLAKTDPDNPLWQSDLAWSYSRVGEIISDEGDFRGALKSFRNSFAIAARFVKDEPDNVDWQRGLGTNYVKIAYVLGQQGKLDEALVSCREGLAIFRALLAKDGSNPQWRDDLKLTAEMLGGLSFNFIHARNFKTALEVVDESISAAPDLIWLRTNRAHALMFLGRTEEARALYLSYRDEKNVLGNKSWVTAILDDFVELRKAALSNTLMKQIEKGFAARS